MVDKNSAAPRIIVPKGSQKLSLPCFECKHPKGDHVAVRPGEFPTVFQAFTNCNQPTCDCRGWFDPESTQAHTDQLKQIVEEEVTEQLEEQAAEAAENDSKQ